jgi:nucleoid DNA-binding protein
MANYLMGVGDSSGAIAFKSEGPNPKTQEIITIRATKVPVFFTCCSFEKK